MSLADAEVAEPEGCFGSLTDPPVESSSRQADIEPLIDPSRPVRHDGSLRPRGRPTLPSLRPIGLRRVDSKAPCGASSQSCRRPPTLSRSHRDALPRVGNEPPEASNIQCFRDGRPRARLGRSRQEILDTRTLKAQPSCRFAGRLSGRLLIRRSLVRAQVGEPKTSEESSSWSNANLGRAADGYWKPPISSGSRTLDASRRNTLVLLGEAACGCCVPGPGERRTTIRGDLCWH